MTVIIPIEVSIRDARIAFQIIADMPVTFFCAASNIFYISDSEEWDAVKEELESQGIEVF